ncbi:MAG: hypothetical protein NTW16_03210, partial [Bacteroidetes bacterium]|nr:hypothetical protein [Bacteroidota bacterium]
MKMLILLLLLVFWSLRIQAETVNTIGTGTSTQKQPFGMYYGYERCATLYTTTTGYITSLGWYVGTGNPVTCPIRIYIKQTTSSTLSSSTWAVMKNGATLVYNGTLSFQTVGWQTIDIADYTHTGTKIIVLCESNYGGIGASTYPVFRYSNSTGAQEWWQGDDSTSVNTTLGTISANRPNIQITYNSISNPAPPSGFLATAVNSEQINLNWIKNSANDSVMVAYNSTNAFGTPSGMLHVGNTITGGGTIIYKGLGLSFSHSSGLSPSNTYYYRAWSVHASPPLYSAETSAAATTPCSITTYFPHLSDFDSAVFPPLCWSVAGLHWAFSSSASGYGIGGGAVVADFFNVASGNFD